MPAEWHMHAATWLAWPAAADLWQESLAPAQAEFISLCETIADYDPNKKMHNKVPDTKLINNNEQLNILVTNDAARQQAKTTLKHLPVTLVDIAYGDIWLRDTAPIFLINDNNELANVRFAFNGWGEKYILPHDDEVAERISNYTNLQSFAANFVFEGGSIDVDGQGTCLTTRQCLLNSNRGAGLTEAIVNSRLKQMVGIKKVLWLDSGLLNDHTDGHVDTLVRFVAPGVVVCMTPSGNDDPNTQQLLNIQHALASFTDTGGQKLKVITIPSPGLVIHNDEIMPASYVNFYIANKTVAVPIYGTPYDEAALQIIASLFPTRRTVGISAKAILTGGGAFHCITQQQPAVAINR